MKKKFFITTPIYYSNDIPHIGHAYSSFIADVYARFHRMLGYDVKFSTWVDENSQKTVQKATEQGMEDTCGDACLQKFLIDRNLNTPP